ncbi:hypothetical protein CU098_004196 [Rhizopus stolonifer]|uniref:RNB domain-containing protein n=1 Tax=Rhizopus stolonifer TaxID=4846 RepID=A0A367KLZ4_RHIST|nr:hypothetical protein CU098_004196 [Rhizopus stolonifer]
MDPFEGQTAPESTCGFFDSPESSTKKDQRRRSIEPTPRNTTYRASLQPVNEDRALSRADVLAETEAKLTRRLSEPNARRLSESNNNNNNNNRRSVRLSISDSSRKPLFVSHLPFSSVLPHLKTNVLVSGILRVNRRNRSNAYVFSEELDSDVYICGSRDRNRALEGDKVAIKLIEVEQIMLEKHEKEEAKLARNNGQPMQRKPDEEDEKEIVFDGEEDVELVPPKYCGTVVAILERSQNQVFSGTLGLTRPSHKKPEEHQPPPRIVWFKSTDKRVPLIAIPVEQAPSGFVENPDSFENCLFLASIRRWPITSLHPFGVLERELGDVKDVEIQLDAIFADNTVATEPILSPSLQIFIEERLDLRHLTCFTLVDQQNALSIENLNEGYKIGLHVSDLSAFVALDSRLDKEARTRVFFVDGCLKKIPLWPDSLREQVELSPKEDKPAFSVVWTISEDGDILDTWIGKSMIHSNMVLTDQLMDEILGFHSIDEESTEVDIMTLYSIARLFYAKRNLLKTNRLQFKFAGTTPTEVDTIESKEIFEEFQLLANTYVAQKIASHFPEQALLVSEPPHHERKMQKLVNYLIPFGYTLDPASLATSIDAIPREEARRVIRALALKCQSSERYLSSGSDISRYFHHGLKQPLYTHFASPLTRYTDFIVQHQLQRVLLDDPTEFPLDMETIASSANIKQHSMQQVRESAQHLFLACYLDAHPQTCDAIVVGVQEGAIDVMVLPFQLERRIHTLHLPLLSSRFVSNELHLVWQKTESSRSVSCKRASICETKGEQDDAIFPKERRQVIRPFDILKVSVKAHSVRNPPLIRLLALNPFQ